MDSHKPILDRAMRREIDPLIVKTASVMDRLIDYGTHLLVECDRMGKFPSITPLLLGRQMIEQADAISVLIRRSCIEPTKIILRSQLELAFSLQYIAKEDSVRRALCYEVAVRHARIAMHQKYDCRTDEGKRFLNDCMQDEVMKTVNYEPYDSEPYVKNLQEGLKKPEYAEVEGEWQRVKQAKKDSRKNPDAGPVVLEWFSLFGGPRSRQAVARAVGMGGFYESIYRLYSSYSHGEDVHAATRTMKDKDVGVLLPLRYPKDLVTVANFSLSMTRQAYRALIGLYLDDGAMKRFFIWWRDEVSADADRVASAEIVDLQLEE